MSTPSTLSSSAYPAARQHFSTAPSFGILSTYPPTQCGLATFTAALAKGLTANGSEASVVRLSDGPPSESTDVVGEMVNGSIGVATVPLAELLAAFEARPGNGRRDT